MSAVVRAMNAVIDPITGIVEAILGTLGDVLETAWKTMFVPVLEFVFSLFGVTDKDVISTEVFTQRIITEDSPASGLITKIMLEEMAQPGVGVIDRLMAYSQLVRNRYSRVFNKCKDDFVDGLPDANLRALYVDNTLIKNAIDLETGLNTTVLTSGLGSIDKYKWVYYKLQNSHQYIPMTNKLTYSGSNGWEVAYVDYNYTLDQYDVGIQRRQDVTTTVTTITVITVTGTDKHTVVTVRTVVEGTVLGVMSDDTVTTVGKHETIVAGSEVSRTTTSTTSSTDYNVVCMTSTLVVEAYLPVRYYYATYYTTNSADWYYWVYKKGEGTYPQLDSADTYLTDLEMLPVITIRNNKTNIDSDKTSARYLQSKQMLKFLGLDLDQMLAGISQNQSIDNVEDSFILFGIRPQDTGKAISKSLFMMFEYILNDSSLQQDGKRVATFREGAYNAAIAWTDQSRTITAGSIGRLGFYSHAIVGKNLVVKWQATEHQYVTITISNLSSLTMIERQGLNGTNTKDVDSTDFYLPLCYHFLKKLSPLEQYELFNSTLLLTTYAAQITHLEWYQTPEFGSILTIIGIVITIVSFGYLTWVNGIIEALKVVAISMLIALAATQLLKMVLAGTDNEFIRGLAMAVYAVVMVATAYYNLPANASMLTTSVTLFCSTLTSIGTAISMDTGMKRAELAQEESIYSQKLEEAQAQVSAAEEALTPILDVIEMCNIKTLPETGVNGYIEGVDAMMYRARDMQYDFDRIYDYNFILGDYYSRAFKVGLV